MALIRYIPECELKSGCGRNNGDDSPRLGIPFGFRRTERVGGFPAPELAHPDRDRSEDERVSLEKHEGAGAGIGRLPPLLDGRAERQA